MAKKAVVLLIALVLVLGVASAAWAQGDSTITEQPLEGTATVGAGQIQLAWIENQSPPQSMWLGTTYTIGVQAKNQGGSIEGVLYIVEIKRNGVSATPADVEIMGKTEGETEPYLLGYDSTGGFFYWGPDTGFTFPGGQTLKAGFSVTFKKAGTYTYKIYAVQL